MNRLIRHIRRYPLTLLCIATVVYLSLFKPPTIDRSLLFPGYDKCVHILMYGGTCSVLWGEYLRSHLRLSRPRLIAWAIVAPILLGGLIEIAQETLTTYRGGDWADFAANSTGVLLAACVGRFVLPRCGKLFRPRTDTSNR